MGKSMKAIKHLRASGRLDVRKITRILKIHKRNLSSWVEQGRFSDTGYCRNPIFSYPGGFVVVIIGWLPGQYSLIHDHGSSIGGVLILQGHCSEETFNFSDGGLGRNKTRTFSAGGILGVTSGCIHRVGNPHSTASLITAHVYSPTMPVMTTYETPSIVHA